MTTTTILANPAMMARRMEMRRMETPKHAVGQEYESGETEALAQAAQAVVARQAAHRMMYRAVVQAPQARKGTMHRIRNWDSFRRSTMEEKAAEESDDVGSEESTLKVRASSCVDEELDGKYVALAQTIKEIEKELSSLKVDEMIRTKLRTFSKAVRPPKRK